VIRGVASTRLTGTPLHRNHDFAIIWSAGAVSEFGTSMSTLVFPLIGYAITHSTAQAGLATTGLVLGEVAFRLPAGALADRFARNRVLLLANVASAVVYGSLAAAVLAGHLTLVHLVLAGVLSGAANAFEAPAMSATLRTVVPTDQLPVAYTRLDVRTNAARLVGPPVGGALYSLARAVPFLVDCASYAVEAFAITRLRTPLPAPVRERRSMLADIGEGLRFVWATVAVRCMMIWGAMINFAGTFVFVAITLRLIHAGTPPAEIGLVETATAVAGILGALAAPAIIRRAPTGRLTIVFTLVMAALVVPQVWATNVAVVGALIAVGTLLVPATSAGISAFMVSVVPDALQGRVNSAGGFLSGSLAPLGPLLAGVGLATLGNGTLLAGAVVTAATTLPLLASRTIRNLGTPDTWSAAAPPSR
jgi:MFS family permease